MAFDATFWVAVSFIIFFGALIYFKIPQNVNNLLGKMIVDIKNEIDESEKKHKEFEKIILESKLEAKNYFNEARQKILDDINSKRIALEKDIDEEISAAEKEVNNLKITSSEKIKSIAVETSSELIKRLIGEEANSSSISAIVEEQSRKNREKQNGI